MSYDEELERDAKLKPPRRFRHRIPHVCSFCDTLVWADGFMYCSRPNGPSWDGGDRLIDISTCDYWRVMKRNKERE